MSEMPKTLTIKNKVRALRMESRWSQEDVAAELDVLKQTIAAIEEQRYNPPLELALKFSELFDTPVEEIFQLH
jgi:putative transcriptional regulator